MIEFFKNISLKDYNTFGVDVKAKQFISVDSYEDIVILVNDSPKKIKNALIIGECSNMLFTKNVNSPIIKYTYDEIHIFEKIRSKLILRVGAGCIWDDLVEYCVSKSFYGLENLSGIPGTVGASAVQNIGAYGDEAGNHISAVEVLNIETGDEETLFNEDLAFGYRDSIFKHEYKDKYIILAVHFNLSARAKYNLDYGNLKEEVEKVGLSLKNVRQTILNIRNSKLPDPKELGSAGSFFKNPIVSEDELKRLLLIDSDIVHFPHGDKGMYKIASGYLIDKAGLKGYRKGDAGVHEKQALVIVNYGKASGKELFELSKYVQKVVFDKYQINIEPEVLIY